MCELGVSCFEAEVHTVDNHGALGVSCQCKALVGAASSLSGNIVRSKGSSSLDCRAVLRTSVVGNGISGRAIGRETFSNSIFVAREPNLPRNGRLERSGERLPNPAKS